MPLRKPFVHRPSPAPVPSCTIEPLEARELLSATVSHHLAHARHAAHAAHVAKVHHHSTTAGTGASGSSDGENSVLFGSAPAAVQTGLTTLATAAGATLTASTPVEVESEDSGTTYKVEVTNASGQSVELVVDSNGAAVTQQGDGKDAGQGGGDSKDSGQSSGSGDGQNDG